MSQAEKSSVPKFGSFKPKAAKDASKIDAELPTSKPGLPGNGNDRCTQDPEHRRVERNNGQEHQKRHERRHGHKSKDRTPRSLNAKVTKDEFEESDVFIFDKRGDSKNVEYGSLHRYSVPNYHRSGFGNVIGLSSNVKVDRDASTDREIAFRTGHSTWKGLSDNWRMSKREDSKSQNLRLIKPTESDETLSVELDFIQIRPKLKRKRGSDTTTQELPQVDYRSIEGQAQPANEPDDEDLEFVSESDGVVEDSTTLDIRQENALLSKRAKENPTSLDAWLVLIDHQSEVFRPGVDVTALNSSERTSLADIRLSIYDRALKHITNGKAGQDQLLLGRLNEGAHTWEASKLTIRWNEALQASPTSIVLWTKFIDFAQMSPDFRYEKCKAAYIHCLTILQTAFANAATDKDKAVVGRTIVYVFLRLTAFIRDCGYDELAYALWQVMLECHFFNPANHATREEELMSLEEFWENDIPRIGEEGARGWNRFVEGVDSSPRQPMPSNDTSEIKEGQDLSFAQQEAYHMQRLQLPASLEDETDSDDPFRHVMFSDLRDVVETLSDELPATVLINGFLCFIRLPALPVSLNTGSTEDAEWWTDPYLRTELIDHVAIASTEDTLPIRDSCRVENYRQSTFSLFHGGFQSTRSQLCGSNGEIGFSNFIDRVLSALVAARPEDEILAEYQLAYQLHVFPDKVAKTAKRLLQARTDSLRLYNAYALVEYQLDRKENAAKVWKAALSGMGDEGFKKDDSSLLWHSWIFSLIDSGRELGALSCLLSMGNGCANLRSDIQLEQVVSSAQRLKASHYFNESFARMVWDGHGEYAVLYLDCWAWTAYLCDSYSLESALQVFNKGLARLHKECSAGGTALEILHQRQAWMIRFHIDQKRPFRPASIRDRIMESIRLFPGNSLFYDLYSHTGPQSRINNRLRDTLGDLGVAKTLIEESHALVEDLSRYENGSEIAGSTADSVRSLFVKILSDPESKFKHSSALWTLRLLFEATMSRRHQSDRDRKAALENMKIAIYNGLRYLPWCKAWVILGLGAMSQVPGLAVEHEEKKCLDILAERELRVRMSIS